MTQQEILEYNKRCMKILEMEYEIHSNTYRYKDLITTTLQFHSDWNWIHEVIEAIEKLFINYGKYSNIQRNSDSFAIQITSKETNKIIFYETCEYNMCENKKEAVVQAINQFLIWYETTRNNTN